MSFIDYFDQTRIINMKSRTDRRQETEEEFQRYQLPVNTDKVQFFNAITPNTPDSFPNIGAKGCFMSHLTLLETAIEENANTLFLLEDDIQFSNQILEHGQKATDALKETDWDIAYFGHLLKSSSTSPHWKPVSEPMLLSHCYAVNGRAIKKLAEFLRQMLTRPAGDPKGGPMHYDGALNTFLSQNSDIKAYYYSKNLGYQRPSKTDIHQSSIIDRHPLLKPASKYYRKLKQAILRATQ
ncbi:glycosyltransferase family 25 protein [Eionea flava]